MIKNFYYSIGKRKTSIAKLKLYDGSGIIKINGKTVDILLLKNNFKILLLPLIVLNRLKDYDLDILVAGGGVASQLEAMQLALTRALILKNKDTRVYLKKEKLVTRDSRIKERRKYGLKKARKASQYSKR